MGETGGGVLGGARAVVALGKAGLRLGEVGAAHVQSPLPSDSLKAWLGLRTYVGVGEAG